MLLFPFPRADGIHLHHLREILRSRWHGSPPITAARSQPVAGEVEVAAGDPSPGSSRSASFSDAPARSGGEVVVRLHSSLVGAARTYGWRWRDRDGPTLVAGASSTSLH